MRKKTVIISDQFEDADNLAGIVKDLGYPVAFTDCPWPRDHAAEHGRKIARKSSYIYAGDEGHYVFDVMGGPVAFVSTLLYRRYPNRKNIVATISNHFGVNLLPVTPTKPAQSHVDSNVMIANPWIICNDLGYHNKSNSTVFDSVQSFGYNDRVILKIRKELDYLPLNCLVLEDNGLPFVIANSMTSDFLDELRNLRINHTTVTSDISPKQGGSIRCRTNEVSNPTRLFQDKSRYNGIFEYKIYSENQS
ncbi:hypothetical protein HOD20_06665 [archaeon]|jgi:hypothetical protein|nr:hypothetical protein [archaeon]